MVEQLWNIVLVYFPAFHNNYACKLQCLALVKKDLKSAFLIDFLWTQRSGFRLQLNYHTTVVFVKKKGHMMRFQVFLSLWSVTSWLCIDKIPEVAKTKVSKPKRYSLSKLRLCHALLKRLVQTRPHMSTSRCGNISLMQPKCSREERRCGFSNRTSVDAGMSGRCCVFLSESKSTLFGLLKVDAFRNH